MYALFSQPRDYFAGNGAHFSYSPDQLGSVTDAPLPPHLVHRTHVRSLSLDAACPQRMIRGAKAIGARCRQRMFRQFSHSQT